MNRLHYFKLLFLCLSATMLWPAAEAGATCIVKADYAFKIDCANRKVFFVNTSSYDSGSTYAYYWKFGDGGKSQDKSPSRIYANAGTYTVCLYVTRYLNGSYCKDSICKSVTVPANCCDIKADFTFKVDCYNKKIVFTENASNDAGASYAWKFGDGSDASGSSVYHVYASAGAYNVCFIAYKFINNVRCADTVCKRIEIPKNCCNIKAGFDIKVDCATRKVKTVNTSFNDSGTTHQWVWGDGSSNVNNSGVADHLYSAAGTYNICLIVYKYIGNSRCADTLCKSIVIPKNCCNIKAGYEFKIDCATRKILTYSTTKDSGITYQWIWGDGKTGSGSNPNADHIYASAGSYNLCLIVYRYIGNLRCADTICRKIEISKNCCDIKADFNFKIFCKDKKIYTQSTSANATGAYIKWIWGDGNVSAGYGTTSDHIYSAAGAYTVCIIVSKQVQGSNALCSDTICKRVEIPKNCCEIKADFAWKIDCERRKVFVESTSANADGATIKWVWGDGTSSYSSGKAADHIYKTPGYYTICIIVSRQVQGANALCSDTICKKIEIPKNCCKVEAGFKFVVDCKHVFFTNTSSSEPVTSYSWDFGDGTGSKDKNPHHEYKKAGIYLVCLTVSRKVPGTNAECKTSVCYKVQIPEKCCKIKADFRFLTISTYGLFTSTSTSDAYYFEWKFPDGSTSTDKNPWFNFRKKGTYNVCLTVWNKDKTCKSTICKTVTLTGLFKRGNGQMVAPDNGSNNDVVEEVAPPVSDNIMLVQDVKVYPNPASDNIMIEVEGIKNAVVTLRNMNGVEISKAEVLEENVFKADVSALPAGVYIVSVNGSNGVKMIRFVKN